LRSFHGSDPRPQDREGAVPKGVTYKRHAQDIGQQKGLETDRNTRFTVSMRSESPEMFEDLYYECKFFVLFGHETV